MFANTFAFLRSSALMGSMMWASSAFADLNQYSFDQLDALWRSGLGATANGPDASWYGLLLNATAEVTAPAPTPATTTTNTQTDEDQEDEDDEDRHPIRKTAVVVGADTTKKRYFIITRPIASLEAKALRRMVDANIYLGRQNKYSGGGDANQTHTVLLRYRAALVEAELGSMLQFFSEPTLSGKCRRASAVLQFQAAGTKDFEAEKMAAGWGGALTVLKTTQQRLNWNEMRQTLCRVRPILSRADTEATARLGLLQRIKARVEALGKDEVIMVRPKADPITGVVPPGLVAKNAPLVLMRAQRESLTATRTHAQNLPIPLADARDNPPVSGMGILSLRRYVDIVEANLDVAKKDLLCGAHCPTGKPLVTLLQDLKLGDKTANPDEKKNLGKQLADDPDLLHRKLQRDLDALGSELRGIVAALKKLPKDLPEAYQTDVVSCSNLELPWPDTSATQITFTTSFGDCLKAVKVVSDKLQTVDDQDRIDREFSRRTMQLSQKILQRLTR